jgi:hypothetical protein
MKYCEHVTKGETRATVLVGEVFITRLDVTRQQKPGKRVRNISFTALR